MTKTITIGNASGYWGDDPHALKRQVEKGKLDYISMDFLAEVTMSIMQKQRSRNPELGYARDFLLMLEEVLPTLLKNNTTLITNAGGVNPEACAKEIEALGKKLGLSPKIAVVYGDDILDQVEDLTQKGVSFQNMESGESFDHVKPRLSAANIYFGAAPVVDALKWNPDIIITGRVTDTGITVAPMIHEFGWDIKDWNKIAHGVVAGHMLECGSQSTGGNFSDWEKVESFDEIGYPIVEVSEDGSFVITKHEGTGGMVSVDTVREQLFYEMGNPEAYITPDVVANFNTIQLEQAGKDRVRVFGVEGFEPTPFYKVSMAYDDGFKAMGSIIISGPNARAKAEKFSEIFWKRVGGDFIEYGTEYFGWNACHRSLGLNPDGNEIMLRLGARSDDKAKLRKFGKMVPSLILSGPPGVAVIGGVPRATDVVSYWPALMGKELVKPVIALYDGGLKEETVVEDFVSGDFVANEMQTQVAGDPSTDVAGALVEESEHTFYDICLARSGDKGDMANVGVLARGPKAYAFIKEHLTSEKVKNYFQELCLGEVKRYHLDKLQGLNFLLDGSLGGGGTQTLRTDAQGKTFSQALLRQKVKLPSEVIDEMKTYS